MGDGSKRRHTGINWLVREETMRSQRNSGHGGRATGLGVWVEVQETESTVGCTRKNSRNGIRLVPLGAFEVSGVFVAGDDTDSLGNLSRKRI